MSHLILVSIGFGNVIMGDRTVAIISPNSPPMKRLQEEAKSKGQLIDAAQDRRRGALVVTDRHHLILSTIGVEILSQRLLAGA